MSIYVFVQRPAAFCREGKSVDRDKLYVNNLKRTLLLLLLSLSKREITCYALISTSTPDGRSSFESASTVREEEV